MKTFKRAMALAFSALLMPALLVACGGASNPTPTPVPSGAAAPTPGPQAGGEAEWEQIVAAARQEGRVVVFGPPGDPVRRALTDGFESAYPGIRVEWSGGRGGEQGARISVERQAGIYSVDVMIQGLPTYQQVIRPLNVTDPIPPVLYLPEVLDEGKWYNNQLQVSDDQMNLGFTISINPQVIYDPRIVNPADIDELNKLLDPRWKDRIVINDPIPAGAGHSVVRDLSRHFGTLEQAAEYLRALREQAGAVDRDQRRIIEWVAQGRYAIAYRPSGGTLGQLLQEGLEEGVHLGILGSFTDMEDSTYSNSFGTLMRLNNPPNPNAQIVFMNWLLTQEGQTAWSTSMGLGSLRTDVPRDHLPWWGVPAEGVTYTFDPNPNRTPEEEQVVQEIFGQ